MHCHLQPEPESLAGELVVVSVSPVWTPVGLFAYRYGTRGAWLNISVSPTIGLQLYTMVVMDQQEALAWPSYR